ncbi:4832_t:CDS:2 [Ambispora leptoticha]|uniref:4832_t:CDS:1 n=1 Tax=Ambispora leptoticha TaxID=144679 RepID=A0A9N8WKZ0_9GLOM|nr:4832_t:CDS:2 [Ambispora leptoticha]
MNIYTDMCSKKRKINDKSHCSKEISKPTYYNHDYLYKINKKSDFLKKSKNTICFATQVPPEIFATICEYLDPPELFALASTCRKFHDYLCSEESGVTQQIWKASRMLYLPSLTDPPWEGMDQRRYTALLILQRTCQICGKTQDEKPVPLYWEFHLRCCDSCFSKNTASHLQLMRDKVPREILATTPYILVTSSTPCMVKVRNSTKIHVLKRLHVYWRPHITEAQNKWEAMKPEDQEGWLDKQPRLSSKMEAYKRRKTAYAQEILKKAEETRRTRLAYALEALKNEVYLDGTPKFYAPMFDYCSTREQPLQFFIFTDNDWVRWRNRMEAEYRKMMEIADSFNPIMCNPT